MRWLLSTGILKTEIVSTYDLMNGTEHGEYSKLVTSSLFYGVML